jgi:hypothetical protein
MTHRRRLLIPGFVLMIMAAPDLAFGAEPAEPEVCWSKDSIEVVYDKSKDETAKGAETPCSATCKFLKSEGDKFFLVKINNGIEFTQIGETDSDKHTKVTECIKKYYIKNQKNANTKEKKTFNYLNLLPGNPDGPIFYRKKGASGATVSTPEGTPPAGSDPVVSLGPVTAMTPSVITGDAAGAALPEAQRAPPAATEKPIFQHETTPEQMLLIAAGLVGLVLLGAILWGQRSLFQLMRKLEAELMEVKGKQSIIAGKIALKMSDSNSMPKMNPLLRNMIAARSMESRRAGRNKKVSLIKSAGSPESLAPAVTEKSRDDSTPEEALMRDYQQVFQTIDGEDAFIKLRRPALLRQGSPDVYQAFVSGEITCQLVRSLEECDFWLVDGEPGAPQWLLISERLLRRSSGLITMGGQSVANSILGGLFNFSNGGPNAPVRLLRPARVIWSPEKGVLKVSESGLLSLPT